MRVQKLDSSLVSMYRYSRRLVACFVRPTRLLRDADLMLRAVKSVPCFAMAGLVAVPVSLFMTTSLQSS